MMKTVSLGVLAPLFLAALFTGCSLFTGAKEETVVIPPPKITHNPYQKAHQTVRDLGSLWSDDSYWNQMYSPTQSRVPGDIVTVKVTKPFLARLEMGLKRPTPVVEEKKDGKDEKKDPAAAAARDLASAPAADGTTPPGRGPAVLPGAKLPESFEVTILEALPRGMYRVAANHGFKPAVDSPFVYIEGVLREREIAQDDTVNSEALLDLKFDTIKSNMKVDGVKGDKS